MSYGPVDTSWPSIITVAVICSFLLCVAAAGAAALWHERKEPYFRHSWLCHCADCERYKAFLKGEKL